MRDCLEVVLAHDDAEVLTLLAGMLRSHDVRVLEVRTLSALRDAVRDDVPHGVYLALGFCSVPTPALVRLLRHSRFGACHSPIAVLAPEGTGRQSLSPLEGLPDVRVAVGGFEGGALVDLVRPASARQALVVDDDPAAARAAELALEGSFQVRCVGSAEAASEVLAHECPDLMVLDIQLGGRSGLELVETLDVRALGLPIVMLTGFPSEEGCLRALKAGALDFVEKPVRPEVLVQRCTSAIAQARHEFALKGPEDDMDASGRLSFHLQAADAWLASGAVAIARVHLRAALEYVDHDPMDDEMQLLAARWHSE